MNKVFSINLGGIPVTIDDDAYVILENYLQSLHNHFKQGEGYEEIIYDIENRMGELLKQGLESRAIANSQDVKNAISIMGKPEDFGAKSIDSTSDSASNFSYSEAASSNKTATKTEGFQFKPGKRLMRNTDDKVVAGVCSGLSNYLGFQDPIFIRIAFLVLFFLGGSSFLVYFVLMIIMPKAVTTADKLAMRGEPVDVNTIADEVGKTLGAKINGNAGSAVRNAASGVGNVMAGIIKAFVIFILVILAFSFLSAWLGLSLGYFAVLPYANLVFSDSWIVSASTVNIFFLFMIPLIWTIVFLRRILFKKSVPIGINIALVAIFVANLFSLIYLLGSTAKEFSELQTKTEEINLSQTDRSINLIGETKNSSGDNKFNFGLRIEDAHFNANGFSIESVSFNIKRSADANYHLIKKLSARGKNTDDALDLLQKINYTPVTEVGGALKLPRAFTLPKGTLWRNQQVEMDLYVPDGKFFTLDKQLQNVATVALEEGDVNVLPSCDGTNRTWKMTKDGIVCANNKEVNGL